MYRPGQRSTDPHDNYYKLSMRENYSYVEIADILVSTSSELFTYNLLEKLQCGNSWINVAHSMQKTNNLIVCERVVFLQKFFNFYLHLNILFIYVL